MRDLEINLLLGERATGLNTVKQEVTVGEEKIHYEGLVIATGASARKLSKFTELDGIHTLRTLDDALAIRSASRGVGCVASHYNFSGIPPYYFFL